LFALRIASLSDSGTSSLCCVSVGHSFFVRFFFNAPATTEIYTLSLHDALPISGEHPVVGEEGRLVDEFLTVGPAGHFSRRHQRILSVHSPIGPILRQRPLL